MLTRCKGEGENEIFISSRLPERDVCHVISRRKCTRREFKMIVELGKYEMEGIMFELGSDVNIFPKNCGN